ncbi:MAG: hypothetical protein H7255_12110 [Ramlibacter sp.]|nr:hypothetical protein [Ramlibacter sp.]
MPQFLIRIYFDGLSAQEQALLDRQTADFGLEPFIRVVTGQRFGLPPGTYCYEGNITADDLRVGIADAITSFGNWQTVVVAETPDIQFHGLMPLDPPPES